MPRDNRVIALMVGLMLGAILLGPLYTVTADNTGTQTVTNESVIAQYDEDVDLTGYNLVAGSETVRNSSGTVVAQSGNYTINEEPGTINVSSSSTAISDGEEITVSYDYEKTGGTTALILGFAPVLFGVAMIFFIGRYVQEHA